MANHKRRRPKQARAGCLLCKPNKLGQGNEKDFHRAGWSAVKGERHAQEELKRFK
jgi:hypothetical protein